MTIRRVPEHRGTTGNEMADMYERQTTEEPQAGRAGGKGMVSMAVLKGEERREQ